VERQMTDEAVLRMRGIAKSFPGVRALSGVDLTVHAGEVAALLGENGAGKSTLMNVLAGVHSDYEGSIEVDGETVAIHSPRDAQRHGIAMIHQELTLVPDLSIADNIFLGREPRTAWGTRDRAAAHVRTAELLAGLGLRLSPRRPVRHCRIAEQQLIEVAKALSRNVRILVMDEPTSALADAEVRRLFEVIGDLTGRGVAVVYISHRLEELEEIADAHQSSATQVSQVQNFIQQKVDVLIVSPNEPAPLSAAVQQACQAKIPVVILDRSVNTDCYSSFIGGDNYEIGKKAGEEAIKELPNGGNVVELRGLMSDQPQIDRDKGFRDAIGANPKIKIVADREAKWLKDSAVPTMQQWLARFPKIDLVYGHNDPMALGAYLAAKAQHREGQITFIGIDGLAIPDGGIRAVQLGELSSTFVYPTCAKEAAETADVLAHGRPVDKKQVLHTTAVTTENAANLYKQYDMSAKVGG
jgi:ribose transport system substrate-binding protein